MRFGQIGHFLFQVSAFAITRQGNGFLYLCFKIDKFLKRKLVDIDSRHFLYLPHHKLKPLTIPPKRRIPKLGAENSDICHHVNTP